MFQMVVNFYGGRIIEFFIRIRHFLYELLKVILLLYIHNIGVAPRKRFRFDCHIPGTKNISHPSNIFESRVNSIIVVSSEKKHNLYCQKNSLQ